MRLCILAVSLAVASAAAQPELHLIVVGGQDVRAVDLNDSGVVAVQATDAVTRSHVWQDGVLTPLSFPPDLDCTAGWVSSVAHSINSAGVVAGTVGNGLDSWACIWDTPLEPVVHDLVDRPPDVCPPIQATYWAINDGELAVGSRPNAGAIVRVGEREWDHLLVAPPGGNGTFGRAINSTGVVAGTARVPNDQGQFEQRPVRWEAFDAPEVLAEYLATPLAINASGAIAVQASEDRSLIWREDGATELGFFVPVDLNDDEVVVGSFVGWHIWLGGVRVPIEELLPDGSDLTVGGLTAINNLGWVSGFGTVPGEARQVGFLLKPELPCAGDLDRSGAVDSDDFFRYLDLFVDGDTFADLNADTVVDSEDFFLYLDVFVLPCD